MAIQQAVPLLTKTGRKMRTVLLLSALGVICLTVLVYGLPGGADQRRSDLP